MIDKHISIVKIFREDAEKIYPDLTKKSNKQFVRMSFANYRTGSGKPIGYLLSEFGFIFLSRKIRWWSFNLLDRNFNTRHLLQLERSQTVPYYYNNSSHIFYTFCPKLAMRLKLAESDIDTVLK